MKTAEEYRREMESYFGTEGRERAEDGRKTEGVNASGAKSQPNSGDVATKPGGSSQSLRLHDYAREPRKRAEAERLLRIQGGCAWSKSDRGVCGGLFYELDHTNGDPTDERPENKQLLCKSHHTIKTNEDRAKFRRSPMSVSVKPEGAFRPRWSSNEGARHDYQRPKFNAWLYDPEIGIARTEGVRFHPKGLAKAAVHGVGFIQGKLGSSVTYERYVEEDFQGGYWRPIQGSDDIERTDKRFPLAMLEKPEEEMAKLRQEMGQD